MRKTPYVISLVVLLVTLALSLTSLIRPNWISSREEGTSHLVTFTSYGLWRSCSKTTTNPYRPPSFGYAEEIEGGSGGFNETCRPFPPRSECEASGTGSFCILWSTAGYLALLSMFPLLVSCLALTVIALGLGERKVRKDRRKAGWKGIGGLVAGSAVLQIVALSLVFHVFRTDPSRFSDVGKLAASFHLLVASSVLSILLFASLTFTGLAAERGKTWAGGKSAGKRRSRLGRSTSSHRSARADESAPLLA
ncbi:hypothetical protein BDY24DRAFT_394767 [Mrakia frigida]|uniref:uncharacterized protein n=1 Tax=Mrakia frigida TaxID=29902 RepID=UPI003FCC12FD